MSTKSLKRAAFGASSVVLIALLASGQRASGSSDQKASGGSKTQVAAGTKSPAKGDAGEVPKYEWDPYWPKRPLPKKWAVGNVVGVDVDSRDHIWIVHRPRTLLQGHEDDAAYEVPESDCCVPAPAVIEFDQAGNVIQGWGGPAAKDFKPTGFQPGAATIQQSALTYAPPTGYPWVESEHTVLVDPKGFVWVGNNGGSHILKFTREGKFVMQVGVAGAKNKGSNDTDALNRPAGFIVDPKSNELYIADGYGNRRVIVFDADTGAYKRHWGAYGKSPDDSVKAPYLFDPKAPPSQQFNTVHCVRIDKDNLVYVCDRANNRIQVFRTDGTFVKEAVVTPQALRGGIMDIAISRDPEQRFLYVADGRDEKVWILRRSDLKTIGSFGYQSHWGGGFTIAHNIAIDSKGNLYVAESLTGQRVQRFKYAGMGAASR